MRIDTFDFALDEALVAAHPPAERDGGRMLELTRDAALHHRAVREFAERLPEGSLLVLNDTRVVPARLHGTRDSGGKIELLLVEPLDASELHWRALGRASKPLRPGTELRFGDGALKAVIEARDGAVLQVRFELESGAALMAALESLGEMPLPPYIVKRRGDEASGIDDRERYQTVFAREPGAVAAPTAGLHLTPAMLERLRERGVHIAHITLHVGLGTFATVTAEDLDDHKMHAERYSVSEQAAAQIAAARARGADVVAVGTTVVRALESAADPQRPGHVRAGRASTHILIQPGYRFQVVDQLLTNFHLPQSTLLALVCAFAGTERVLAAYATATAERYRFFSYGDAMWLARAR